MKPTVNPKPHIIITVGIPGSGKSYFAEHFANTFKAQYICSNIIRDKLFDKPTFSKDEEEIINEISLYMLDEALKSGRTIIYDGRTEYRSERDLIAKKAKLAGYDPLFVWVQTDNQTAKKRVVKAGGMANDIFEARAKRFTQPQSNERIVVVSGKHTHPSQLRIVLKHLVDKSQAPIRTVSEPPIPSRTPGNRNFLIR